MPFATIADAFRIESVGCVRSWTILEGHAKIVRTCVRDVESHSVSEGGEQDSTEAQYAIFRELRKRHGYQTK